MEDILVVREHQSTSDRYDLWRVTDLIVIYLTGSSPYSYGYVPPADVVYMGGADGPKGIFYLLDKVGPSSARTIRRGD